MFLGRKLLDMKDVVQVYLQGILQSWPQCDPCQLANKQGFY